MGMYLGIDTSNYTTSAALYFPGDKKLISLKRPLKVRDGEIGLRQNEAVFQHTVALPELMDELFRGVNDMLEAVCVSAFPRNESGSYMPCFLVGGGTARSVVSAMSVPLYRNSHQAGHIIAALYSAGKLELVNESFLAFHVSGGTTEALLVNPDSREVINEKIIAKTLDLNAGQAIDRVGAALGLPFPAGARMDALARESRAEYEISPALKAGCCCFSGLENLCKNMIAAGAPKEDVAKFCIDYISETLRRMTLRLLDKHGRLPLVFSGGVMANSLIRERFSAEFGAYFAEPEFSSDNAAGIAVLGFLKNTKGGKNGKRV